MKKKKILRQNLSILTRQEQLRQYICYLNVTVCPEYTSRVTSCHGASHVL